MTPLYALTGSPGAKAQPGFAGRGHSIAKRRRGPAGEPVHPGETLLGGGGQEGGASGPTQSLGRLPCSRSTPTTTLESLSLPCWGTLCFVLLETCFHHVGGPASFAMKSSFTKVPYPLPLWPHLPPLSLGSLPWLLPLPGTLLPHIHLVHSLTSEVELQCPPYSVLDCLLPQHLPSPDMPDN